MSIFRATPPSGNELIRDVRVVIDAVDGLGELYLTDAHFSLVASGFGMIEAKVSAGVYKVKLRLGEQVHEEFMIVRPTDSKVTRTITPPPISSSAPLSGSAKSHEYHVEFAVRESRNANARIGTGAWIFVMSRHWTPDADVLASIVSRDHPAAGLRLWRSDDPAQSMDIEQKAVCDFTGDPCAACNVQVSPGTYILSLTLPSGRQLNQTIVACAGWQTTVFLLQRVYPGEEVLRSDLLEATILMDRGAGFAPDRKHDKLVEVARLALLSRRPVVRREISRMLETKFDDPMLGLFGGHLLLLQAKRVGTTDASQAVLREVVKNLRILVGSDHPDVEALSLALPEESPASTTATFAVPPMLGLSWGLVQTATCTRAELVPAESILERAADNALGPSPWMVWESGLSQESRDSVWLETVSDAALSLTRGRERSVRRAAREGVVKAAAHVVAAAAAAASVETGVMGEGVTATGAPSLLDALASLAKGAYHAATRKSSPSMKEDGVAPADAIASALATEEPLGAEQIRLLLSDDTAMRRLAQMTSLPRGALGRALERLEQRSMKER